MFHPDSRVYTIGGPAQSPGGSMKRAAGLIFAAILAASEGVATTYYALEVRGGSRIYSLDQPVRKGRVVVFHRFPDGIFMSLTASEVEKLVSLSEPPAQEGLAPGQSMYIGSAVEGPYAAPAPAAALPSGSAPGMSMDSGYGYYGSYWGGGYVPPPRPPMPPPFAPPPRIGANGFPILAPPGSAGSIPPSIGPNGFPILSPQAPAPRPR
jgi:hypothetical protein